MKKLKLCTVFLFCLFFIISSITDAQPDNYIKEYISVAPGPEYEAGRFKELFLGEHWRDLWVTPVKVPLLNLEKFDGGLKPYKQGGGMATKSLRLWGSDGRDWKFRSVNKNPDKVLPEELRNTFAADILRDQTSASNPLAALVAAPLLNAVGILQAEPRLVYMPDDPALGEFREDFANTLGIIEIHPQEGEDNSKGFGGSDKIVGTYKLFERLETKRTERVNAIEFLKARLMDILMNDWDRHSDQWRWARYKLTDTDEIWMPIPRDRDQPFAKYDGIGPSIAAFAIPQLNHFDYEYPGITEITWSGRYLDRRYLTEIREEDWMKVTEFIKNNITDDVIENAVRKLPPEHYEIAGNEIISKLKSRRDKLDKISFEFFKLVNGIVDIYCSDEDDYVEITRNGDTATTVIRWRFDDKKLLPYDHPLYWKVFDNNFVEEIRIYLQDGDDMAVVEGYAENSPLIRVIGGDEKDRLEDYSYVKGNFLTVTPFKSAQTKTRFYDSGNKTKFVLGAGTYVNQSKWDDPDTITERYEPTQRDRGYDILFFPEGSFSSDDGLIIGAGANFSKFNFRRIPYEYRLSGYGKAGLGSGKFEAGVFTEFKDIFTDTDLLINGYFTRLEHTRYYGYGNDVEVIDFLEDNDFYRYDEKYLKADINLKYNFSDVTNIRLGAFYKLNDSELFTPFLSGSFPRGAYGLESFGYLGMELDFISDTRNNENIPRDGYFIEISVSAAPELLSNVYTFFKSFADLRTYYSFEALTEHTIAMRAGGEKIWGKYPFFEAAFLGGKENMRGFSKDRFSGDASVFGQIEWRSYLFPMQIIIPSKIGISLFLDGGKVFTDLGESEKWHFGYGFGIWSSFAGDMFAGSASIGFSEDETTFYITTGMSF